MRHIFLAAAALCLLSGTAQADDGEYGAYLFKGTCASYAPKSVIEDVGDLDFDDHATREWARLSPDHAVQPNPVYIEDESTRKVTPDQLAAGGFAIAVTGAESRHATLIACGEIPQAVTLPFVGPLAEVNGSGMAGRVAIETHRKGVKFTIAAFARDAVPALEK